jgi:hypothetical protein
MKKTTTVILFFLFLSNSHSQSVVWSDNFDDLDVFNWTLIDYDSDGNNWKPTTATYHCIGSILADNSTKYKQNNFITSPQIDLSAISTNSHLKWEEFVTHSNFTKYYEVIITEQNDINSILNAAAYPIYKGFPTTVIPNRNSISVQIPDSFLGKKIYVTFRHHQSNNVNSTGVLFVDNVSIKTTLSLSKQNDQELLSVFPNPTNGILNLKGHKKIDRIEVIDILGKIVMKVEVIKENKINIKDLNSGLYVVKIFSDHKINTIKVVKQSH